MKPNRLKQLSEKEFLERLEKSRKQSKDGKGKDADTAIKEIRKKYNLWFLLRESRRFLFFVVQRRMRWFELNKQFDLFQKMKIKEVCENISRMTYAYINPDTKQPTVVPSKHYKDILDQPVEVLVNDQVKKQFLNIMFKQMKTLKEEEPILFNETLLLMDLNKTPDSLELNEEAALKITATELVESEKTQKKKFHLVDNAYLDSYEATKNDSELMAQIFGEQQNDRVYSVELDEMEMEKPKSKGGKKNDLQH